MVSYKMGKRNTRSQKKSNAGKKSVNARIVMDSRGCVKKSTEKYRMRNSPPYPANQCHNHTKTGNDGQLYMSSPNRNGIYTWKKL